MRIDRHGFFRHQEPEMKEEPNQSVQLLRRQSVTVNYMEITTRR